MNYVDIIERLKSLKNEKNIAGMARFGIDTKTALGIPSPVIKTIAREIKAEYKKQPEVLHSLALELWQSGIHEARKVAVHIDVPSLVTEAQMERWVKDFNSWDICDDTCGNLFDRTPFSYQKAAEWAERDEEFVRRAGFALMAWLTVHDKKATDEQFEPFFALIEKYADDDRNFVKKAVSWALRQIGKARPHLREQALEVAVRLKNRPEKSARWIGSDAFRELSTYK